MDGFKTIILRTPGMKDAWIEVPFRVLRAIGKKPRTLKGNIDGCPFEGKPVRAGTGFSLAIPSDVLQAIGKRAGDEIYVTLKKEGWMPLKDK